jgi:hypothetical protein
MMGWLARDDGVLIGQVWSFLIVPGSFPWNSSSRSCPIVAREPGG